MFKKIGLGVISAGTTLLVYLGSALADTGLTGAGDNEFTVKAALALAAGFGLGLAAFGGAIGQSKAAAAALEGIARNPGAANKVTTPMIIGLALIESLVIYVLIIAFILQGKI